MKRKYCDPTCEDFEFNKDVPGCKTFNPGYCTKHEKPVQKSQLCLDDQINNINKTENDP